MEAEPLFSAWPGPLKAYQRLTNSVGESGDSKDAEVARERSISSSTFSPTFCVCA